MMNSVYLDHNILDALLKRRISPQEPYLDVVGNTILYSNETLIEIRKSKGYEHKFLELLRQLSSKFLFVESNASGHVTGRWEIRESDPFQEYDALNGALSDTTNSNFGFDEIIQKLYGGVSEKSFFDIAVQSTVDLEDLLDKNPQDIQGEMSEEDYRILLHDLKDQMRKSSDEMGELLDISTCENFTSWEDAVGVGPRELNNIIPPKVVEQVWKMLAQNLPEGMAFEKMFGLAAQYDGAYSPKNNIERCNAIYHALNFFGYHRDTGMKKLRRVHASSSDMTHAGYASLCSLLVSDDEDFCLKVQAVYEYLNIDTQIIYTNLKTKS